MTYQHALRYITQPTISSNETIELTSLTKELSTHEASPIAVCFSNDKIGQAAAALLESILCKSGVRHLRWSDVSTAPTKQRFALDGTPLSPPLLSEIAGNIQQKERAARALPSDCLSQNDRCAAVLAEYAKACGAAVLLLQSDTNMAHTRQFGLLFSQLQAITVVSQTRQVPASATMSSTREVISLPCGSAMFRRISDACVASGSRLSLTQGADCHVFEQTIGARTIQYRALPPCRIFSASSCATDALFLALECVLSLRRMGISISDQAIAQGPAEASLPFCCSVLSIHPLILADQAQSQQELLHVWEDLSSKLAQLPEPRGLWLDPDLARDSSAVGIPVQEIYDAKTPLASSQMATSLIVGSPLFIEKVTKPLQKSQKR